MAGPWGDLSPHLHQLLKLFAESRVAAMGRAQGREAGEGMLGKVMGEIRRAFSVAVVRSQALCLFERLSQLGPGQEQQHSGGSKFWGWRRGGGEKGKHLPWPTRGEAWTGSAELLFLEAKLNLAL